MAAPKQKPLAKILEELELDEDLPKVDESTGMLVKSEEEKDLRPAGELTDEEAQEQKGLY